SFILYKGLLTIRFPLPCLDLRVFLQDRSSRRSRKDARKNIFPILSAVCSLVPCCGLRRMLQQEWRFSLIRCRMVGTMSGCIRLSIMYPILFHPLCCVRLAYSCFSTSSQNHC